MNTLAIFVSSLAVLASASRPQRALNSRSSSSSGPAAVDATYDGSCFYPKPTEDFVLQDYLGRWYQAASTTFGPTTGCECVFADYALNVSTLPSYFMTFAQKEKKRRKKERGTNGLYSHSTNMIRFLLGQRHSKCQEWMCSQWDDFRDSDRGHSDSFLARCWLWCFWCSSGPISRPATVVLPGTKLCGTRYWCQR